MHWLRRAAVLTLAAVAVLGSATPAAEAVAKPTYYVSLGDSLAAGHQPSGDTDKGYVDVVAAALRRTTPGLQERKFGCTGETVSSMLGRSVCPSKYAGGSQLAAAVAFLRAHRGQTKYLTIDIGANDVSACAATGTVQVACARSALKRVATGLATVLGRLHQADPSVPVSVGLTYYDPYLAASLLGETTFAADSLTLQRTLNVLETAVYSRYGYRIADVATAFHTGETTPRQTVGHYGSLPLDVAYVCRYTYICNDRDIHPTDAGYRILGSTVLAAIRR